MKKIIYLFSLVILMSCKSNDKKTMLRTYYTTGELRSECFKDVNGQINGVYRYYYKNGQLNFTVNLKNNLYDGKLTSYFSNGVLESEENYTLNKLNGWSFHYDSLGKWVDQLEYKLIYSDMTNKRANIFLEPDTFSIENKESYICKRIFYNNKKLIRDSSFCSKIEAPAIIKLGDTLHFDLFIVYEFFKPANHQSTQPKTTTKIMNSEFSEVESFDALRIGFKYKIPYWRKGFFVPKKRGIGYLFGFIIEEKDNGEYFEHYFKKSYKVE